MAWGPSDEREITVRRSAISAMAASQEIRSNLPSPFLPTRRIGYWRRSAWYVRSTYRFTLVQRKPLVTGWSGSPDTLIARLSSTVTSMAHVSGQSWGQAPRTTVRSLILHRGFLVLHV